MYFEDTQTLMAGLTERLSSAANETSQDIQRLTFTLLGAIVANIFLVFDGATEIWCHRFRFLFLL